MYNHLITKFPPSVNFNGIENERGGLGDTCCYKGFGGGGRGRGRGECGGGVGRR
jgi:hypothetical protein